MENHSQYNTENIITTNTNQNDSSLSDGINSTVSTKSTHPWRRCFARFIDSILIATPITFLLIYLIASFIPISILTAIIAQSLLWLPIEALFISRLRATPGKWIFGIHITNQSGENLSFEQALKRVWLVIFQGQALGLPLISFVTQTFAFFRLKNTGTTLWDTSIGSVVTHKKWTFIRATLCTLTTLLAMVVATILINA